jgi:hypothetical protein
LPDWTHVNSVAFNAELDQIIISVRSFNEFWIIDHGTTKSEAARKTGGRRGKGGDLLYRWGNPSAYKSGSKADQRLFAQHDAQWISKGSPGAGHVLVFNNGGGRPGGEYSSVDELVLPVDENGDYSRAPDKPFGPIEPVWSYSAPRKEELFSFIMSGANRLPNGNTLICESVGGTIFEVAPGGETVWKYVNPARDARPMGMPGGPPMGGPSTLADVLPPIFQFMLNLTSEQRTKLEVDQQEVEGKLSKILAESQRKQLLVRRAGDPMGFSGMATPGQIVSLAAQTVLKLTPEQRSSLSALQKEVDAKIAALLDDKQKDQMKEISSMASRGSAPGSGPGGPGSPIRGPGGPPGMGAFPMGRGGLGSSVFRAYRYGKTIEEVERQ